MSPGGASPRRRGDYFERQTRADLEAHGWLVLRSGGSLGVADLIAVSRRGKPLLVSCKLGGRISQAERTDLATAAERYGCHAIVASRLRPGVILYRPLRADDDPTTIGP